MIMVHVDRDQDTWVATSPDVPGWTAVADSERELYALVWDGVTFALEREDLVVSIGPEQPESAYDPESSTRAPAWLSLAPGTSGSGRTYVANAVAATLNGIQGGQPVPA
jgi:hypothetical protein